MKRIIYYLEYLLFLGVAAIMNSLSLHTASKAAEKMGDFLYWLLRRRREMMISNLHAAFPEKSSAEIKIIGRASMHAIAKIVIEFVRIPKISKHRDMNWQVLGAEHCRKALEKGKGFIVTVGHLGNWELMGLSSADVGLPLHAIARPIKNPYVYDYIKKMRLVAGFYSIDKEGAARATMKLLRQNKMIAMLIDQRERQGSVQVDFFGRKAWTSSLPAILSMKYGTPIIPTFFYRERPDFFIHTFGEPFPVIDTGNHDADLIANTQQYVSAIEREIRKRPGDWLWMHNRWRQ